MNIQKAVEFFMESREWIYEEIRIHEIQDFMKFLRDYNFEDPYEIVYMVAQERFNLSDCLILKKECNFSGYDISSIADTNNGFTLIEVIKLRNEGGFDALDIADCLPTRKRFSIDECVDLAKEGLSPEQIVKLSNQDKLSASDLIKLRKENKLNARQIRRIGAGLIEGV